MENRVGSNVECSLAITVEKSWSFMEKAKSFNNTIIHTTSLLTLAIALGLDSAEDLETTSCFLHFHEINDSPRKTQNPEESTKAGTQDHRLTVNHM